MSIWESGNLPAGTATMGRSLSSATRFYYLVMQEGRGEKRALPVDTGETVLDESAGQRRRRCLR